MVCHLAECSRHYARDVALAHVGLPDHVEDLGFAMNLGRRRLKGATTTSSQTSSSSSLRETTRCSRRRTGDPDTDTGYVIVGLILERVTGHDYYDEVRTRILDPLNLGDVVPATASRIDGLAAGDVAPSSLSVLTGLVGKITNDEGTLAQMAHTERNGGGLFTTPAMLVQFDGASAEGRVVSPTTLQTMIGSRARAERSYGYGMFGVRSSELGRTIATVVGSWLSHRGRT